MTKKHLTDVEKRKIVKQVLKKNRSVEDVATDMGRSRRTIQATVNRERESPGKHSTDRKGKLSHKAKKYIMRLAEEDPSLSAVDIIAALDLDVSVGTLCKYLNEKGGYECENAHNPLRTLRPSETRNPVDKCAYYDIKSKLTRVDKLAIDALVEANNTISSRQIVVRLNLNVSHATVCKYLRESYDCLNAHMPNRMQT